LGVYPDNQVHLAGQRIPTGVARIEADDYNRVRTRKITTPGDIAVIDTGVSPHPDLNLYRSVDCASDEGCSSSSPAPDAYGHGTLVAGVAAAKDNHRGVVGVAPGARIWNVRVFNDGGFGATSWVVAGLDWIAARADRIEVANASLQGYEDAGITAAVEGATRKGVVVVVAAGNDGGDASRGYPASVPAAITVSAFIDTDGRPGGRGRSCETDPGVFQRDDTFLDWSNFGSVVDVAAPGACITSTAPDGGYDTMSGTSIAAPHAAGAALLWINKAHLRATPKRAAKVESALRGPWSVPQRSRCGFLKGLSAEPVLLLHRCRH
jgi:subtilisin family serine protease